MKYNSEYESPQWFANTKSLSPTQKELIQYALEYLDCNIEDDITLNNGKSLTPTEVRNIIKNISL